MTEQDIQAMNEWANNRDYNANSLSNLTESLKAANDMILTQMIRTTNNKTCDCITGEYHCPLGKTGAEYKCTIKELKEHYQIT